MILPDENDLVLPETNDNLVIDRTDRPAPTIEDLLALLPAWAREAPSDVRDAIVAAWREVLIVLWARYGQVIARYYSPRFADGPWLDDPWGKLLQRPRAANESDADYRARLLDVVEKVSPNAIRNGVLAIYEATGSAVRPAFMEPTTDFVFANSTSDPDVAWCAFVQSDQHRLWAMYPDNPNPHVGVFVAYQPTPPEFWVIAPGTAMIDTTSAYASSITTPWTDFVSDVATLWPDSDLRFVDAVEPILDRVISDVEGRRAFGVRFALLVDPLLLGAK